MVMKMFKNAIIVFIKEMKDILRDKKTFLFGLIIPFLLIPTMLFAIDYSMNFFQGGKDNQVYVAINNKENSFYRFCTAHQNIKFVDTDNPQAALNSGRISAYINIQDNIDDDIINKKNIDIDVEFGTSSLGSMLSASAIGYYKELYLALIQYITDNDYAKNVEELRVLAEDKELNQNLTEIYPYQGSQDIGFNTSSLYFNMLVPMMLILYCCIGSSSTASDLSAGEKERGSLEALLSTGASRTSIIVGKLFATTVMGLISGLCTVLGLSTYLMISSDSQMSQVSVADVLALLATTLFTSMFFAAVNLAIGVYSKSSKEAQTYLMPVSIISLIPTYFTYSMDLNSINLKYLCIPIVNVICIIKEILAGVLNFSHLGIVIAWLIVYIAIAFSLTAHMFKKESVIFRI